MRFRFGARDSQLSLCQSASALAEFTRRVPGFHGELVPMSSPGDQDQSTDLRQSPPDFFTRFLDDAVLAGEVDGALHSAKDLPETLRPGLDWFWLPWAEDARDVVVCRLGQKVADLPPNPVIGISSERRDAWCRQRFPKAAFLPVRGTIERRLAQLDAGDFDFLLMAAAALHRLDLSHRITAYIPASELPPPAGQGYLAVTFRAGDARLRTLRELAVKPVIFLGAGPGDPELCTAAGIAALRACEVCLYDALAPEALLAHLPATAQRLYVGKRGGHYSVARGALEHLLQDFCRQGKRVVRLKGGDPGIFGRLAQELQALDQFGLPFRVIPGISSLLAATTGTGLMLTRRGVARGFTVVTPRQLNEDDASVGFEERLALPLAFFMAVGKTRELVARLRAEGRPDSEPAAMVYGASQPDEEVLTGTLANICERVEAHAGDERPGLLLVGQIAGAAFRYSHAGSALGGARVLLTGGPELMAPASQAVHDFGGLPMPFPLIHLNPEPAVLPLLRQADTYDWLVLSSPAAARCLLELYLADGLDLRRLPRLLATGPGAGRVLASHGLRLAAEAEGDYSAAAFRAWAGQHLLPGQRALRLRSDLAGESLADTIRGLGLQVTDAVLYRNTPVRQPRLPPFAAVFFASASAVRVFTDHWGVPALAGKDAVAIGEPTAAALRQLGVVPLVARRSEAATAIETLAAARLARHLRHPPA